MVIYVFKDSNGKEYQLNQNEITEEKVNDYNLTYSHYYEEVKGIQRDNYQKEVI